MGMSGDFEEGYTDLKLMFLFSDRLFFITIAIEKGATHVRVGSTIFGERDYGKH